MSELIEAIRTTARRLLEEKKVGMVIGFRQGKGPLHDPPFFARTPEDAGRLVWGPGCVMNLATFLKGRHEPMAIVARACEARAVMVAVQERQVARERVTIIGVPCRGIVSREKLWEASGGREVLSVAETEAGNQVILRGNGFEKILPLPDLWQDSCLSCTVREPPVCDIRLTLAGAVHATKPPVPAADGPAAAPTSADPTDTRSEVPRCRHGGRRETPVSRIATGPTRTVQDQGRGSQDGASPDGAPPDDPSSPRPAGGCQDGFADIRAFSSLSMDARWAWFEREFSRCIRCFACRNACPLCSCERCFVESTDPEWIGRSNQPADAGVFHLVRALHSAGRCIDCGACEAACPMGIDLRRLTRKVQMDVKELFGAEPGLDEQERLALSTFASDDPEDFLW